MIERFDLTRIFFRLFSAKKLIHHANVLMTHGIVYMGTIGLVRCGVLCINCAREDRFPSFSSQHELFWTVQVCCKRNDRFFSVKKLMSFFLCNETWFIQRHFPSSIPIYRKWISFLVCVPGQLSICHRHLFLRLENTHIWWSRSFNISPKIALDR